MRAYRKNVEELVMADRSMEVVVDDEALGAKLKLIGYLFVVELIAEAVGSEVFEEAHSLLFLK